MRSRRLIWKLQGDSFVLPLATTPSFDLLAGSTGGSSPIHYSGAARRRLAIDVSRMGVTLELELRLKSWQYHASNLIQTGRSPLRSPRRMDRSNLCIPKIMETFV